MSENVPKTSFDYLEGHWFVFNVHGCMWWVMKSYYCLEGGWYYLSSIFFGIPMIPHTYIQQSTIEIEDVYCQYKG